MSFSKDVLFYVFNVSLLVSFIEIHILKRISYKRGQYQTIFPLTILVYPELGPVFEPKGSYSSVLAVYENIYTSIIV